MARTVKHPEERRGELIASARNLFFSKGFESTSINDIVADVGVAKGTFYYYFDSKNAILESLVQEMSQSAVALLESVVDDPTLPAIEKWAETMHGISSWKTARKPELLEILRALDDENLILNQKMRTTMVSQSAPVIARIIEQGVGEGVFDTEYPAESAEIAMNAVYAFSDRLTDILFHPENYDDPRGSARRTFMAVQTAVERIIGAPPGSLPMADDDVIDIWFESSRELSTL